jgi:hypothetical protein
VNWLVILAIIALAYVAYRRRERERGRALTALGAEIGLAFQRKRVVGPQQARLPLFKFSPKAVAKNILSGTAPAGEVLIFDYFCPTYGDSPTEPIEQTVAAFRFPGAQLPLFKLQDRTFLDKVPNWVRRLFGGRYREVTLDSSPDFSNRFLVLAKDVDAVRALFTPQMACVFVPIAGADWQVEASGEWLLAYRRLVLLEPKLELYREFIAQASTIASALAATKWERS